MALLCLMNHGSFGNIAGDDPVAGRQAADNLPPSVESAVADGDRPRLSATVASNDQYGAAGPDGFLRHKHTVDGPHRLAGFLGPRLQNPNPGQHVRLEQIGRVLNVDLGFDGVLLQIGAVHEPRYFSGEHAIGKHIHDDFGGMPDADTGGIGERDVRSDLQARRVVEVHDVRRVLAVAEPDHRSWRGQSLDHDAVDGGSNRGASEREFGTFKVGRCDSNLRLGGHHLGVEDAAPGFEARDAGTCRINRDAKALDRPCGDGARIDERSLAVVLVLQREAIRLGGVDLGIDGGAGGLRSCEPLPRDVQVGLTSIAGDAGVIRYEARNRLTFGDASSAFQASSGDSCGPGNSRSKTDP